MERTLTTETEIDSFVTEAAAADGVDEATWLNRKMNAIVKRVMRDSIVSHIDDNDATTLTNIKTVIDESKTVSED